MPDYKPFRQLKQELNELFSSINQYDLQCIVEEFFEKKLYSEDDLKDRDQENYETGITDGKDEEGDYIQGHEDGYDEGFDQGYETAKAEFKA